MELGDVRSSTRDAERPSGRVSPPLDPRHRHLALIGLMGVGKSTVGRLLAERLSRELWDNDRMLREMHHRSVAAVAASDGVDAMHALEDEVLRLQIAKEEPAVLAIAAAAIVPPANRALLASRAVTIWLSAPPDRLAARIRASAQPRPFVDTDLVATLTRQLAERRTLYETAADLVIDLADATPERTATTIISTLRL